MCIAIASPKNNPIPTYDILKTCFRNNDDGAGFAFNTDDNQVKIVKGFMIESFLVEGAQKHDDVFGKSITDPCLGWEDTERLFLSPPNSAEQVQNTLDFVNSSEWISRPITGM